MPHQIYTGWYPDNVTYTHTLQLCQSNLNAVLSVSNCHDYVLNVLPLIKIPIKYRTNLFGIDKGQLLTKALHESDIPIMHLVVFKYF